MVIGAHLHAARYRTGGKEYESAGVSIRAEAPRSERPLSASAGENADMLTFILWCLLLVLCWPLAILALILYPFVWLILLPFRLVGIAVGGILELFKTLILLPSRVLKAR